MANYRCQKCHDKGFLRIAGTREVIPCDGCNPDGMPDTEADHTLRCGDPRGGGGRTCYLAADHKGSHAFECGK